MLKEKWRDAWQRGLAPQFSVEQLKKLRTALVQDDPALIQGATCSPPPLECVQDWPAEAVCLVGFCGWDRNTEATVAEVEEFFAKTCFSADQLLGEPAACRWFLNWFDDTPRDQMRREMLVEVDYAIDLREKESTQWQNIYN